jgi:hypothetical protein
MGLVKILGVASGESRCGLLVFVTSGGDSCVAPRPCRRRRTDACPKFITERALCSVAAVLCSVSCGREVGLPRSLWFDCRTEGVFSGSEWSQLDQRVTMVVEKLPNQTVSRLPAIELPLQQLGDDILLPTNSALAN